ncbi:N-acetyl sugar amidotransferase [Pseudoalteromonas phenolica]|uniref:N-acetyl sugar amidotransferase n=1 Tax=Pseudoalteromonas phenolica TaxID=161398 RepID=A0A5R9PWS6_9GAMM|nr:N-acetyl sugar amidotransferase [Pseudoalteromonas phenolica]TLX45360.1 N-acetyl sugar amidotransferase [Pseudoalteromonas phenolica]
MSKHDITVCTRCVMDTTDDDIYFDDNGVCNYCNNFDNVISKRWQPDREDLLEQRIEQIKREGKGKEYDCIIGLSGGIDSSYLAVKLKDYGLRPLVVHVDAGWNSELAVHNIKQVVDYCGFDLHTHVMNWNDVQALQLAYLKAGVANQDVVQDHSFFSTLYHFAVKNNIKTVISGGNIATESIFPSSWHHSAMDAKNIHSIFKKHGQGKLKDYSTISMLQYYIYYPYIYKMKTFRPLNFMHYDKDEAMRYLVEEVGYKEYGRKHGESIFTRFFQNHYLPAKFGYDKRKPHLASLINAKQLGRDEALKILQEPLYDEVELKEDLIFVAQKLGITVEELQSYISEEGRSYKEYSNWDAGYKRLKAIQQKLEKLLGREIKNYA